MNLLANLNTCSLPENLNLVTWHKTRVISRVKASPLTPTPANRSRARGRKSKFPAKRATSTTQDKTSPISVSPSSVSTEARRPVTRSTSQQRSDSTSATTYDSTPLGTDTAGDTASAAPSSAPDPGPTPDPAGDAAETRTSTRPPLIMPVSQTYRLNYDTEAYLETSEEEDNGSKGKSVNLCYYHSFSSFLSFLCCMLATYRPLFLVPLSKQIHLTNPTVMRIPSQDVVTLMRRGQLLLRKQIWAKKPNYSFWTRTGSLCRGVASLSQKVITSIYLFLEYSS